MSMRLDRLAEKLGLSVVEGRRAHQLRVDRAYAGDRISDILNQASDTTLIVTNLANSSVVRVIELMDVPGVCLLNGIQPDAELVEAAREHGAALLVSPEDMYRTCGRVYQLLESERAAQAV